METLEWHEKCFWKCFCSEHIRHICWTVLDFIIFRSQVSWVWFVSKQKVPNVIVFSENVALWQIENYRSLSTLNEKTSWVINAQANVVCDTENKQAEMSNLKRHTDGSANVNTRLSYHLLLYSDE